MLKIRKISPRLVDSQNKRGAVENHGERVPTQKSSTAIGYSTQLKCYSAQL
jgi:hypothetical protein